MPIWFTNIARSIKAIWELCLSLKRTYTQELWLPLTSAQNLQPHCATVLTNFYWSALKVLVVLFILSLAYCSYLATYSKHCSIALKYCPSIDICFPDWYMHACMLHFWYMTTTITLLLLIHLLCSWSFNFCSVILGRRTFGKPGSLPLSSQVLNSSVKCHSSRIFLDLDHSSYYLYYSWCNSRTCGSNPSFILDLWSNLFTNIAFWISLDINKIVFISTILWI